MTQILDKVEEVFGKATAMLGKLVGAAVILIIVLLMIYWFYGAISALPVSAAIIVGALIIASALRS